jgi:hypothetical protein
MPEQIGGYATALFKFLAEREAAEKRTRRRAREKALYRGKVTDPDKIALGNILREIAEISTRNRTLNRSGFANLLNRRPKYRHLSLRTLRRRVTHAIEWVIEVLQRTPPSLWLEFYGIDPPPEMTKHALFEKSLEFLRTYLRKQKLAKNP